MAEISQLTFTAEQQTAMKQHLGLGSAANADASAFATPTSVAEAVQASVQHIPSDIQAAITNMAQDATSVTSAEATDVVLAYRTSQSGLVPVLVPVSAMQALSGWSGGGSSGSGTAPTAITGATVASTTATTASLTWGGGTGATNWAVEKSTDGGTTWSAATTSAAPNANGTTVTGLTAATTYSFRITASNGTQPDKVATCSGTTAAAAPPAAPNPYTITTGGTAVAGPIDASGWAVVNGHKSAIAKDAFWTGEGGMWFGNAGVAPVHAYIGVGDSANTPPAIITSAKNTANGEALNGLVEFQSNGVTGSNGAYYPLPAVWVNLPMGAALTRWLWLALSDGTTTWFVRLSPAAGVLINGL